MGSSATTPLVDFHHRRTACPSYIKTDHLSDSLFAIRFMRMQKYNASEKCRPANSPAALTKEFLRLAYLSVRMFPLLQRFVHPSDNSSPDLSFETHYGCSPVWDSHPTSVSYPSKYEIISLCYYNTIFFWFCK